MCVYLSVYLDKTKKKKKKKKKKKPTNNITDLKWQSCPKTQYEPGMFMFLVEIRFNPRQARTGPRKKYKSTQTQTRKPSSVIHVPSEH